MTDSRKSPKRTKRMWGVFREGGSLWKAVETRAEARGNAHGAKGMIGDPYFARSVTVTWSAPNTRKAKRT